MQEENQKIRIEVMVDKMAGYYAVQGRVFQFGLRLTNIGDMPTNEFTISNIKLSSAEGKNILEDMKMSFFIGKLNPNEIKDIEFKTQGTLQYGLISVQLNILPQVADTKISFYQRNHFTHENFHIGTNQWMDFLYIKTNSEYLQEVTNNRMIFLTYALFALTVLQLLSAVLPIFLSWKDNLSKNSQTSNLDLYLLKSDPNFLKNLNLSSFPTIK